MGLWPLESDKKARQPSHGTVEDLLAQISALPAANLTGVPDNLRLWVASELKYKQVMIEQNLAMALVLDALLDKGFMPDGFTTSDGGRWYEYVR